MNTSDFLKPGSRALPKYRYPSSLIERVMGLNLTVSKEIMNEDHVLSFSAYLSPGHTIIWVITDRETLSVAQFWEHFCCAVSTWSTKLAAKLYESGLPTMVHEREALGDLLLHTAGECGTPIFFINHPSHFAQEPIRIFLGWLVTKLSFSYLLLGNDGWPHVPYTSAQYIALHQLTCKPADTSFLLHSWRNIKPDDCMLHQVQKATGGWIPALFLLGKQLEHGIPLSDRTLTKALSGIHAIIDREFFSSLDVNEQESLALLSLLPRFTPDLVERFTTFTWDTLRNLVNSIFVFESQLSDGTYSIRPIMQTFLLTKQHLISGMRRAEFLQKAARWYEEEHHILEPFVCYLEAGAYDQLTGYLTRVNPAIIPHDICVQYGAMLDQVPPHYFAKYPLLHVYRILICLRVNNVSQTIIEMQHLATSARKQPCGSMDPHVWGEYHLLKALLNLRQGKEFLFDMMKASEYLPQGSKIFTGKFCGFVGTMSCLSLAGTLSMEERVAQYCQATPYMDITMNGYGRGVEYLAQCEAAYYRGDLEAALDFGNKAVESAVTAQQWDIATDASFVCMRANICIGDWKELNVYWESCSDYSNRNRTQDNQITIADMAQAMMYYVMGSSTLPGIEVQGPVISSHHSNRKVQSMYEIIMNFLVGKTGFYEASYLLDTAIAYCVYENQWIIKLYLIVFQAFFCMSLGQTEEAAVLLERGYLLVCDHEIIAPFAEFGPNMVKLTRVAQEHGAVHSIPMEWLEKVEKHAVLYDAGMKKIRMEYLKGSSPSLAQLQLTRRERQAFLHLCSGKSIAEIAYEMEVTISTVKSTLSHAYKKLGVKNKWEALDLVLKDHT